MIVTAVPGAPDEIESPLMFGAGVTVNATPLLLRPPEPSTTGPVVAPMGTGTIMLPSLQLNGVATVPLNWMVLVPCGIPKPEPVTVTLEFAGPLVGEMLVMLGGGSTVKLTELEVPACVTTTGPVVAPFGTGVTI